MKGALSSFKLIIVRHAQSEDNARNTVSRDPVLTARGRRQARALAKRLCKEKVVRVYCSDRKRAIETASFICKKPVVVGALHEIDFGRLTGLNQEALERNYPGITQRFFDNPGYRLPGGESTRDLQRRALPVIKRILKRKTGTVVVVAHNVTNRVLIASLLGLPLSLCRRIKQKNCAFATFFVKSGRVEFYGLDNSVHYVK